MHWRPLTDDSALKCVDAISRHETIRNPANLPFQTFVADKNTIDGGETLDLHNILGHDCYCLCHTGRTKKKRPKSGKLQGQTFLLIKIPQRERADESFSAGTFARLLQPRQHFKGEC